jgi:hypothetical protein
VEEAGKAGSSSLFLGMTDLKTFFGMTRAKKLLGMTRGESSSE